ncbi:YihY/virulence factor BrkB family protein [Streptomyces dangxiongensis]|uniref:YihY/virulence factor BrkB family protein n=1 Tax=Streptomyces dangxiongensis TaxID=1442032 RepID=A0A3G2JJG9_9ACTN|nr:YihY/virulence factor BrkB family protein [Streptomyces dangxiongensis]AYN42598.1 YihY/virulence factor BrkB family protein [Streptomyces dangxiongensis]
MNVLARLDRYQRRHRWAGMPLAVVYKFFDDQAAYLAALLAYYGFVSLFPLLLFLVAILSAALHGNPQLQQSVLHSALGEIPVIGDQLGHNIHSFHGNGAALAVGVIGSLYGALGVAQAVQHALNKIFAVPRHARPDPLRSRARGLSFLVLLAVGLVLTTALSTAESAADIFGTRLAVGVRVAIGVAGVVVNAALLLLSYRLMTRRRLPLRVMYGPALGAASAWQALQWGGSYYVGHVLRGATATYGMFGIVLGLLAWIYLAAVVYLATAEIIAVRSLRLWPRSLLTPFTDHVHLATGDLRAYRSYAATESFKGFEKVSVRFGEPPPPAVGDKGPP